MFDKIKRLGTDTAVYGVSTILGRFLTFLLTPLYANILPPADLGIVATIYAYIAFLNVVYHYGMETAYMKFVTAPDCTDREQVFSLSFVAVAVTSASFSLLILLSVDPLTIVLQLPDAYKSIIVASGAILFLDAVALIPFALLRIERKAKLFATIRLSGIVINVIVTAIFLIHLRMGIEGIFLAGVLSSAATLVMLLPIITRNLTRSFSTRLLRPMLLFGLPTVPAGLAAMVIQVVDRPLLEAMTDEATVGVYQANYRLGIFMMLVVSMFEFAWRPFFFTHAGEPDARRMFARVLTYLVLLMAVVLVFLGLFLGDIVRIPILFGFSILPEAYWGGLTIVPVVMLGYLFLGMSTTFSAGIYIERKTGRLPMITFVGAGVNIAANLLLIPQIGIMGAAVATLLSYAVMAVMTYLMARQIYPVPYEFRRLAKIAAALLVVFLLHHFVHPPFRELFWKCTLLGIFFVIIAAMRFFEPAELASAAKMLRLKRSSYTPAPPPSEELNV